MVLLRKAILVFLCGRGVLWTWWCGGEAATEWASPPAQSRTSGPHMAKHAASHPWANSGGHGAMGRVWASMWENSSELGKISARTLAEYDRQADQFWAATRDHDVSQNMAALLGAIESTP